MKTLQISKFYPPVSGGIETVVFELTEGLNRRGIATDVLCSNTVNVTVLEQSRNGYRIIRSSSFGKILSTPLSPLMIYELSRLCKDYEILHVQMPNPMAALALWVVRPRCKIIIHWQSDVVNQLNALKFYLPLQNWLLRRADSIIATTKQYVDSSIFLQDFLKKVQIIPIGITPLSLNYAGLKPSDIHKRFGGRKIIFSLGRMTYYKGFDVLIEAAKYLGDDSVFVVGGGGELLKKYRERVVAEKLDNRIYFIGRIANEDLAAYYEAASIFCLPSIIRAEAYGVVLLEAMAMGKPIVSTDIPGSGVPWVNKHSVTGINVPVLDAKATVDAINFILNDPDVALRFGEAGKKRFRTEFSAEVMVTRTAELYQNLLRTAIAP